MAIWDQSDRRVGGAGAGLWDRLRALFGEAWERQRRRRRRWALGWALALAVAAVLVVLVIASGGRAPVRATPAAAVTQGNVSSVVLPAAAQYSSMGQVGGRLLVWGSSAPTGTASAPFGSAGTCTVSVVDPATLGLTDTHRGSCQDPALFHEHVLIDETYQRRTQIDDIHVSVALPDGNYRVGPVLGRSEQCSDCQDASAYADGDLWIYLPNPLTPGGRPVTLGPDAGELLEVSGRSGALAHSWRMPSLLRALLVGDQDGLWIAPSLYSGFPEGVPASQRDPYETLYRVAPNLRRPEPTQLLGPDGARWIVASGSTVWIDAGSPTRTTITALQGPGAHRIFRTSVGAAQCGELGAGAAGVGGDEQAGLDCFSEEGVNGSAAVFRYSARTGRLAERTRIGLQPLEYGLPGAVSGRDFFLLAPAGSAENGNTAPGNGAGGVLYRVRPGR